MKNSVSTRFEPADSPDFVAEAKKCRLTIGPVAEEELKQTVAGLFNINPSTGPWVLA